MLRPCPRRYDDGEILLTASDHSGAGPAGSKLSSLRKTRSYGAPTSSRAPKSGAIQASFSYRIAIGNIAPPFPRLALGIGPRPAIGGKCVQPVQPGPPGGCAAAPTDAP